MLEIPAEKRDRVVEQFRPYLTLIGCENLDYEVQLDAEAVHAWVQMGPNAWHLTPDQIAAVRFPGTITASVACTLLSFGADREGERGGSETRGPQGARRIGNAGDAGSAE